MSKNKYTKKDILSTMEDAKKYRLQYGWFGHSKKEVLKAANNNDMGLWGQVRPENSATYPFGWTNNFNAYEYFIPVNKSEQEKVLSDHRDKKMNGLVGLKIFNKYSKSQSFIILESRKSGGDYEFLIADVWMPAEILLNSYVDDDGMSLKDYVL